MQSLFFYKLLFLQNMPFFSNMLRRGLFSSLTPPRCSFCRGQAFFSLEFSDAHFHMLFGFSPASGQESVTLVCPHCRLWLPAHSTSIWISAYPASGSYAQALLPCAPVAPQTLPFAAGRWPVLLRTNPWTAECPWSTCQPFSDIQWPGALQSPPH